MTALSRSMLPSTLRSASRLCGGRRSASCDMATLLAAAKKRARPLQGLTRFSNALAVRLLLFGGFHDEDFYLGLNLVTQIQFHRVQSQLLDRPLQADHFRLDMEVLRLERLGDFRSADRAVQMPFLGGGSIN